MDNNMLILLQVIALLPTAIQAGLEIKNISDRVSDILTSGREPTAADWDALNAEIAVLRAALNKDPD